MLLRRYILVMFMVVVGTASAQNYGRWETATNIGESSTGDLMLTRCHYQTLGGYEFSIVVRGMCPFSVQVNPETGQVKR